MSTFLCPDSLIVYSSSASHAPGLPPSLEFPLKLEGLPAGLLNYLAFVEAAPQVPQVGGGGG